MMVYKIQQIFDQLSQTIKPGDCLYIKGALCNHRIVEDIALLAWRKGALPYFTVSSFAFDNTLIQDELISQQTLSNIPLALQKFYDNTDHLILIEPLEDPLVEIFDPVKRNVLELVRNKLHSRVKKLSVYESAFENKGEILQDPEFFSKIPIIDFKLKKCASVFYNTLKLEKGEFISIKGGIHAQRFLEEIALECLRNGIKSMVQSPSDYYKINFLGDPRIKCETIGITHRHESEMMKKIDARILIEPSEDPNFRDMIKTKVDIQKRNTALVKSRAKWLDIARKKKYIYSAYPTKLQAKASGVPYKELEQVIIDGICSINGVKIITNTIADRLEGAKNIIINDHSGTDFWVSVENREIIIDDGEIKKENQYLNFPCGEVAFPVQETKGEGTIFSPVAKDFITDKLIRDLFIPFKKGKVILDGIEARSKEDSNYLINSLMECMLQDEEKGYDPIRTTNLCELGIGTNDGIHKPIGGFFDEKMLGSIHLAIGGNAFIGGSSESILHMDFVTENQINMEVEYKNGSKKILFKNGTYVK